MKKRTQSKQNSTISFGARLFLLVLLASLLSSCGTVLQTPMPTATATEMPTIPLIPEPTATATELPTITPTLEPTLTATEIPLIQGDIFYDPQSKEDIKNVALAPSPFEEPENLLCGVKNI